MRGIRAEGPGGGVFEAEGEDKDTRMVDTRRWDESARRRRSH